MQCVDRGLTDMQALFALDTSRPPERISLFNCIELELHVHKSQSLSICQPLSMRPSLLRRLWPAFLSPWLLPQPNLREDTLYNIYI